MSRSSAPDPVRAANQVHSGSTESVAANGLNVSRTRSLPQRRPIRRSSSHGMQGALDLDLARPSDSSDGDRSEYFLAAMPLTDSSAVSVNTENTTNEFKNVAWEKLVLKCFKSVPADEPLFVEHFCAYQGDSILQQGKMYLSPNFFCFYANIFGKVTSFEFPIQDIVLIERAKTAYIIPNAIIIATLSKAYFFTSFVNRENTVMNMEYLISRHRQTAHQDQPLPSSQVLLAANVSSSYSNKDDAGPVISKPIQRSLWEDTSSGFEARSHKPAARRGRPDAPKLFQTSTDPMQTKLLAFISIMAMSILICMMLALGSTLVLWKIRTVIGRMEVVALAL